MNGESVLSIMGLPDVFVAVMLSFSAILSLLLYLTEIKNNLRLLGALSLVAIIILSLPIWATHRRDDTSFGKMKLLLSSQANGVKFDDSPRSLNLSWEPCSQATNYLVEIQVGDGRRPNKSLEPTAGRCDAHI